MSNLIRITACLLLIVLNSACSGGKQEQAEVITLSGLMDEMVSQENDVCFPVPYYAAKQLTSYDRRSVLPGTPSWFSNDDFAGFIRYEANNGRVEKVLFDEKGPGVITRIITTGSDKDANLRFYFDGEKEASITIPSYDISKFPVDIPAGMIYMHEHYPTTQGCSFYYPIPYREGCKITVDNVNRVYVYHVNYRQYEPGTEVETFTVEKAKELDVKAQETGNKLLHPSTYSENGITKGATLKPKDMLCLDLPAGSKAIRTLNFKVQGYNPEEYGQLMRGLIVKISFDGVQTVEAPLSDFSGGGMGSPAVDSWYLSADGKGNIALRFVMPYKKDGFIEVENITGYTAETTVNACVSDWEWLPNTLYFHAGWRQECDLQTNVYKEYNMATLSGRGIFKGDVLSLYNYCPTWYGEGDEHIWVDEEELPSHIGCGTEDYYNTTYAPIHVYHNPFGGAPREDDEASRGYNTFVRTRNLDVIPFNQKLRFDFELISWKDGKVDYSSTVFWYGDLDSKLVNPTPKEAALYVLPPAIYTGDK